MKKNRLPSNIGKILIPVDLTAFSKFINLDYRNIDLFHSGKRVRHGCRYGRKAPSLSTGLGISLTETTRIYEDYKIKYRKTFEFSENFKYKDNISTPILRREIQFNPF